MGRFKQLFTGEGHGCKTREKPRNLRVALSQEPDSPSRDAHNIFELFCRYQTPFGRENLMVNNGKLPTSMETPDQLDLKVDDVDSCLPHEPIRRMSSS